MSVSKSFCLIALFTLNVAAFAAEDAPAYNLVELQAEAQRELPNDTLNASLYVELNDADPAALADKVNKITNESLRAARRFDRVRLTSGNNHTYPVYDKGRVLQGWRARAELKLESKDFAAASRLIGELQAKLQLANTSFSVSPEARRLATDELIAEAIAAFRARAEVVRASLAGRGYKIRRLNLGTGYRVPAPRFAAARALSAAAPAVAAPEFESGVSTVTVTASGTIEVLE